MKHKGTSRITRLGAVAIYLAFLAILLEGTARVVFTNKPLLQRIVGRDETSWRWRWLHHEPGTSVEFYDAIDVFDGQRGWALMPGLNSIPVSGNELFSNSRGLRGKTEFDYTKPEGIQRVLLFGDSYTFGEEVGDQHTYATFLQQDLPHIQVLNFGVHGYGHDQALVYFREEGVKYQPDIVVLGFVGENMERNICNFWHRAKPKYVLKGEKLKLTNVPVPSPQELRDGASQGSRFFDLMNIMRSRWAWRSGRVYEEMATITGAILDAFIEEVRAVQAVPILLYIPTSYERAGNVDVPGRTAAFFRNYIESRDVLAVDLGPYFDAYEEAGFTFKAEGHWGADGHQVIARGLKELMAREGLIKPGQPVSSTPDG